MTSQQNYKIGDVAGLLYNGHFKLVRINGFKKKKAKGKLKDGVFYVPDSTANEIGLGAGEEPAVIIPSVKKKKTEIVLVTTIVNGETEMVADLIDSARCYLKDMIFVVVNLSNDGARDKLKIDERFGDVIVIDGKSKLSDLMAAYDSRGVPLKGDKRTAIGTDMHFTFCQGMKYALQNLQFKYIVKIDTDALILAPGLENVFQKVFSGNVGLAGCWASKCNLPFKDRWGNTLATIQEEFKMHLVEDNISGRSPGGSTWSHLNTDKTFWAPFITKAQQHDYKFKPGDYVQGGCYALSRAAVAALNNKGLLGYDELVKKAVWGHEDMVMSTFVKSLGFKFGHICGKNGPFIISWHMPPFNESKMRSLDGRYMVTHALKKDPMPMALRKVYREKRRLYRKGA